jgi:GNAT superfamily N-acetyltransferase
MEETGVAELKRVFVAPEHRGCGYGKRLLAELERRAVACGYTKLMLETGDRQPESIALYERAGFRRIPNYGPYVGSHWSVCFAKAIGLVG